MSYQTTGWALDDAPTDNPTEVLVLVAMAERARKDGTGVYLSIASIANRARCSQRTVYRTLKAMESRGLIRRGDQKLAATIPAHCRPVVWDLSVELKREVDPVHADDWTSQPVDKGGDNLSGGDTGGTTGVTPVALPPDTGVTQTVVKPLEEPPTPARASIAAPIRAKADHLVRQLGLPQLSDSARRRIVSTVATRLQAGVGPVLIEDALAEWCRRPEFGPGMLDTLIDGELKRAGAAIAASTPAVDPRAAARRQAIDDCLACDPNGFYELPSGAVKRCNHLTALPDQAV